MVPASNNVMNVINSPVRKIDAKVELYNGSTLVTEFKSTDKLINFTIERVGEEGKFFGVGICQHIKVDIIDIDRKIDYITTDYSLKVVYEVAGEAIVAHPIFYITQTRRDENTNQLSIYGYDLLYAASSHTIEEVGLAAPYAIIDVARKIAEFLNASGYHFYRILSDYDCYSESYDEGANLDGSELIRDVLDDMAEATGTIYFINYNNDLVFKRLNNHLAIDIELNKSNYIELDTSTNRRLTGICHTTELGDNISKESIYSGTTQYVRDNSFWEKAPNLDYLIDRLLDVMSSLTINQFDCTWRGNFLVEPGDKIGIITKDNETEISYLLDDTIEYDGSYKQVSRWSYKDDIETESNPTSLGDMLRKTYAKVDKANQSIELVVNKVDNYDSRLAAIELNADSITSSVEQIQKNTDNRLDSIDGEIDTLTNKVEATISSEAVEIKIKEAMSSGVNSVSTETGFTFNDIGLTVSKSGSEMKTTITEDGMRVFKNDDEMLVADNKGVKAVNLHATTYLHIGTYSRFQDYENRTGCFWIV